MAWRRPIACVATQLRCSPAAVRVATVTAAAHPLRTSQWCVAMRCMSASSFESLGLGYHLPEALAEMGIVQPTPIQVCCGRQAAFSFLSHTEAFECMFCVCVFCVIWMTHQTKAVPAVLSGSHTLLAAQTGVCHSQHKLGQHTSPPTFHPQALAKRCPSCCQ